MNTLRAKIALLLVVAIVSVVGILTWVMIALLGPPPPQRTTEPLADQVEMFLRVAKQDTSALTLVPEPSGGDPRENATARLRTELAKRGLDLPVTISRKDWNAPLVVSIPIAGKGWLLMPIADLPPQRKPWYGLLKWLALITVGVSADRHLRRSSHGAAARAPGEHRRIGRARRHPSASAGERPGRSAGNGASAQFPLLAAPERHREPHAAACRRRSRSSHPDHAHAAPRRVRGG